MKTARLLNVSELAAVLHLHPQTVYAWKRKGRLPFVALGGRIRFDQHEVERFIEERRIRPLPLPLPKVDFSLSVYDRFFLKGGEKALSKNSRRWNYGIGSVSVRKTKTGHDRWCLDYRSREGERRREVAKHARTRAEAVLALQSKVAREFSRAFGGENPSANAGLLCFAEFAERYLVEYAEKTKRSAKTDRSRLRPILEEFGESRVSEITKGRILDYRSRRLEDGISRSSTNRELMLLSKMFSWGEAEGLTQGNPAREIKKFSEADTIRSRVLSETEEAGLLRELASHIRPIVLVALHSGLRCGEILNLPWRNVDLEKRTLKIEGTKSGKARFVPINSLLHEVFEELKARWNGAARVFPCKSVRTGFEKACRRAGIGDFHFHDLRRTFGTRLLEKGTDIITVSRLLGHSNVVTTQRYLHPSDSLAGEAVEKLAEGAVNSGRFSENLSNGGAKKSELSHKSFLFCELEER